MILRQSDASRCPGLQPLTPTLAAHRESGLVRRREADIADRDGGRLNWADSFRTAAEAGRSRLKVAQ